MLTPLKANERLGRTMHQLTLWEQLLLGLYLSGFSFGGKPLGFGVLTGLIIRTYRAGHRCLKHKTINAHTPFSSIFPLPLVYFKNLEWTMLPLRLAHPTIQPTEVRRWAFQLADSHLQAKRRLLLTSHHVFLFPWSLVSSANQDPFILHK